MKSRTVVIVIFIIVLIGVLLVLYGALQNSSQVEVSSFEECVAAKNPVLESFPPQCKTNGKTFTQTLPDWKADEVSMMRIPNSGQLACFGCGAFECKTPAPDLKLIEETPDRHCTENFEVVTGK